MNNIRKIYDVSREGRSLVGHYFEQIALKEQMGLQFEQATVYDPALLNDAEALLIHPDFSDEILATLPMAPVLVRNVWALDSFFKDEGGWLCRVLEFEALRDILVLRAKEMDTLKPAFIIGDGAKVRIAAAVVADLGFSEIYLVSENEEELQKNTQAISKNYIGIKFHRLMAEELTMQALNASLLINAADLGANAPLLNDLSYFNFMARGGLVFDYNLEGYKNDPLLEEAERAELALLPREDLASALAMAWMKHLGVEVKMSVDELKDLWRESVKNTSSV